VSEQTLLEFPCDFPHQGHGPGQDGFAQAMLEVVLRMRRTSTPPPWRCAPEPSGNYMSLTCTIRAVSRNAQLDALYAELSAHPLVKVVL
jgi:putative lipoic acid-binding regulatory protein